jgi:hypothetical protein
LIDERDRSRGLKLSAKFADQLGAEIEREKAAVTGHDPAEVDRAI